MREWLADVFARPRREPPADIIIPARRSDPLETISTPEGFVAAYIKQRLAVGEDYSGRGAQTMRDRLKLKGQRGFGNKALTDLVAKERTKRGHGPNLGGKGSKG
jgi:hypothetical protein